MNISIEQIMSIILNAAHSAREGAGFGGRWDDGGAGALETQVRFYRYGQQGIVPPEWREYAEQAKKEADPEYATYQRLQQKFGK